MAYFRTARNVELSVIFSLETDIAASWTGINVVKSFANAYDVAVPVVCIRLLGESDKRLEIGNNTLDRDYFFIIDVFAKSDGQRIDLADFITDKVKDGFTYYEWAHASGSNTTLTKTANGKLTVTEITENSRVDFGENVEQQDKFRHTIAFTIKNFN